MIIPWERLRYKVTKIKVIDPYDTDKILIQKGKDMITLLTCHPYRGHGKYRYLDGKDHGQKIKKQERTQQSDSSRKTIEEEKWIRYAGIFLLKLPGGSRTKDKEDEDRSKMKRKEEDDEKEKKKSLLHYSNGDLRGISIWDMASVKNRRSGDH